jgi:DedD protein
LNQSTRQRIVGAVVLLVAALILLPVIFDGQGSYQAPLESRIPAPPPFPENALSSRVTPPTVFLDDDFPVQLQTQDVAAQEEEAPPAADSISAVPERASDPEIVSSPALSSPPQAEEAPVASAVTAATPSATPQLDHLGLPQGWSVRMASFGVANNANQLVQRLQAGGHRAYTRSTLVNGTAMQVVYVGPLVDENAASRLLDQMNREYPDLRGKRLELFKIEGL